MSKKMFKQIVPEFMVGDIVELNKETTIFHSDGLYRAPKGVKLKVIALNPSALSEKEAFSGESYFKDDSDFYFNYTVDILEEAVVRGPTKLLVSNVKSFTFYIDGCFLKAAKQKEDKLVKEAKPLKEKKVKFKKTFEGQASPVSEFKNFPRSQEEKFPVVELPQLKKGQQTTPELSKKEKKDVKKAAKGTKKKGDKLAGELTKKHEKKQKNKSTPYAEYE